MRWAIIENAGYDGERIVWTGSSQPDAYDWLKENYDAEEIATLHVDVAHWDEEGEFWSYDH